MVNQKKKLLNSLINRYNKLNKKIIPKLELEAKQSNNKRGNLSRLLVSNKLLIAKNEKIILETKIKQLKIIIKQQYIID
jgi:hypothetical protein